jgi:hypothetical protein
MANLCVNWVFGDLTIYAATSAGQDRLVLVEDGITGWDAPPVRRQRDPASRINGANVFHAYTHGHIVQVQATMSLESVGHEDGLTAAYSAAYDALEAAVKTALFAKLNTPTAFGPSGGGTINCVYGSEGEELVFSGPMINRLCTFVLLEADTIID